MLVVINEPECIGCTKCIQACPVDAILGSQNQMHTVISDECIGCELCIPPCPVDCISLVESTMPSKNKELTIKRAKARKQRLNNETYPLEAKTASEPTQSINQTLARIKALKQLKNK